MELNRPAEQHDPALDLCMSHDAVDTSRDPTPLLATLLRALHSAFGTGDIGADPSEQIPLAVTLPLATVQQVIDQLRVLDVLQNPEPPAELQRTVGELMDQRLAACFAEHNRLVAIKDATPLALLATPCHQIQKIFSN